MSLQGPHKCLSRVLIVSLQGPHKDLIVSTAPLCRSNPKSGLSYLLSCRGYHHVSFAELKEHLFPRLRTICSWEESKLQVGRERGWYPKTDIRDAKEHSWRHCNQNFWFGSMIIFLKLKHMKRRHVHSHELGVLPLNPEQSPM